MKNIHNTHIHVNDTQNNDIDFHGINQTLSTNHHNKYFCLPRRIEHMNK